VSFLSLAFLVFCEQTPRFTSPHLYEHGMNIPSWWVDGYDPELLGRSLTNLVQCGGDWIIFVPTWYQDNVSSTDIYRTQRTVADSNLTEAIQIAQEHGFKLMLKPHVDMEADEWRGNIDPSDTEAWFISYKEMILHYADMCETYGVERLCIGTELTAISSQPHWLELIDSIRTHYAGQLTFAADWNGIRKVNFWNALDYVGVDFYGPLASRESDDVETYLTNICEWFDRLDCFAKDVGIPIIVTEIGFRSTTDSPERPWDWKKEGVMSETEQAECYRVVLETFPRKDWLAGIYFWMWNPDPDNISSTGYSPQNKQAEEILKELWQ
jgi:sugar phosphate isomerase/epimerase